MEGSNRGVGWTNYPGGDPEIDLTPELSQRDRAAQIVRLGAHCRLASSGQLSSDTQSFRISEFVLLDTGRRVQLHEERGVTLGTPGTSVRDGLTADDIIEATLGAVRPDGDSFEDHPWDWLAKLARAHGLDVTADRMRILPYDIELDDCVVAWLES